MKYSTRIPFPFLSIIALLAWVSSAQRNSSSPFLPRDDSITLLSITQLLSLFSISLDTKNFTALGNVFADDAVLNGGGGGNPLTGLPAIEDFYQKTFQNATLQTQHTSDTVFGYNLGPTTASSVSYANALYFGPPVLERGGFLFPDQSVIYREKFQSDYVRGADGAWKIRQQTLFILVTFFFSIVGYEVE